jgi:hypothetical protein
MRMAEHDGDVRHRRDTTLSRHFNLLVHDWKKAEFDTLELIHERKGDLRLLRETYWIATLQTLAPNGLNVLLGRQFSV